jgi:hypothetical protein
MKRFNPELDDLVNALLEHGRIIRRVPDVVRARALLRARATITEGRALAPHVPWETPARGRGLRIALAVSVCLAVGAAVAGAALRGRVAQPVDRAPASSRPALPTARFAVEPLPTSPVGAPQTTSIPIAKRHRLGRTVSIQESISPQESYAAELGLLQRAQVACVTQDFSGALVLVAEHARQFPNGRLAEEREALRVRSLAGSGRVDEARRAGAAFAHRFPRSVLLPRLEETVRAAG